MTHSAHGSLARSTLISPQLLHQRPCVAREATGEDCGLLVPLTAPSGCVTPRKSRWLQTACQAGRKTMEKHGLMSRTSRREFLKKAGIGSAALATMPALGELFATPALASDRIGFSLVAASKMDFERVILAGDGLMTDSEATGGGTFVHFSTSTGVPVVIATGVWQAKRLHSFTPVGTPLGLGSSGIADMDIDLIPANNERVEGRLKIFCNLPGPGRSTGGEEGFMLTVDGKTFEQAGAGASLFTFGAPS
jgi:hypothetical protein